MRFTTVVALLLGLLLAPATASALELVEVDDFTAPIDVTAPPYEAGLFVVERGGTVQVVRNGAKRATPFLTVPNVDTLSERGLLSMAFAPDYATSGRFYVFYVFDGDTTDTDGDPADQFPGARGDLRIVEYRRSTADPDVADPASARVVISQAHGNGNHNGGSIRFGPDGNLYVSWGDNGPANAQNRAVLLGKVLRIRPTPGGGYAVPADNPFVGEAGVRPEIFAYGLRNPFRLSIDRANGDVWVGDVGQSTFEEVNRVPAGGNLGWATCEGNALQPPATGPCPVNPHSAPVLAYGRSQGQSITGGLVVRDPGLGLTGRYLFADFFQGQLRSVAEGETAFTPVMAAPTNISAFGEDAAGCVYVAELRAPGGVYRLAPDGAGEACPLPVPVPPTQDPPCETTGTCPVTTTPGTGTTGTGTTGTGTTGTGTAGEPPGATDPGALPLVPADTSPPGLRARTRATGREIRLSLTTDEAATVTVTGRLRERGEARAARSFRLRTTRKRLAARTTTAVRVKLPAAATRRARSYSARLQITAADLSGNRTRSTRRASFSAR